MRGAKGYLIITDPDPNPLRGEVARFERDTFTCAHCNTVHTVKPMASVSEAPGRCFQCDALICQECLNKPCLPFERKLDAMERRDRLYREIMQ